MRLDYDTQVMNRIEINSTKWISFVRCGLKKYKTFISTKVCFGKISWNNLQTINELEHGIYGPYKI